jgi:ClpP class serine protease
MQHRRVLSLITSELWAIEPEVLKTILAIAKGENESPEAVAAKLGRPLRNARTVTVRDGVAMIPFTGPIFRYANLFTEVSGATSVDIAALDFNTALEDDSIHSIIAIFDTPGGQTSGISELSQMIHNANKPVHAFVANQACSAGYWLASACDSITCSSTSLLGSIGTIMQISRNEEDDTETFISAQSPFKNVSPSTDEGKQAYQSIVDKMTEVFISDVAAYRGVSVEAVMEGFGKGGVFVGQDAVKAGLADSVGTLEDLLSMCTTPKQRGKKMAKINAEMTGEVLATEYPDLVEAIRAEAYAKGFDAGKAESHDASFAKGAEAERNRIKAVEAQLLPGHEDLIAELKFDGITSGPEAAVMVLAAEKSMYATRAERMKAEVHNPLAFDDAEDEQPKDEKPTIAELQAQLLAQVGGTK